MSSCTFIVIRFTYLIFLIKIRNKNIVFHRVIRYNKLIVVVKFYISSALIAYQGDALITIFLSYATSFVLVFCISDVSCGSLTLHYY